MSSTDVRNPNEESVKVPFLSPLPHNPYASPVYPPPLIPTENGIGAPSPWGVQMSNRDPGDQNKARGDQFNIKIALSTFSSTLIVAHLGLVAGFVRIQDRNTTTPDALFEVATFFSFIAMAFHAINIVIAGRAAVLYRHPDDPKSHRSIGIFNDAITICEHLRLYGNCCFVVAVVISSFIIFANLHYPIAFCGLSVMGLAFLIIRFREASILYHDFQKFQRFFNNRLGKYRAGKMTHSQPSQAAPRQGASSENVGIEVIEVGHPTLAQNSSHLTSEGSGETEPERTGHIALDV